MTPSFFSVSYAGFWGQSTLSLTDFIRHAGRLGFPSVMIAGKRPHLSPLDATPDFVSKVRDALAEARVRCEVRAAPHTIITTNADYIQVPRHRYRPELVNYERQGVDWVRAVPFGTGFIDYPAFFNGLRAGGFNGTAVFEMCSPLRGGGSLVNLDACATTYLNWMRTQGFTGSTSEV